MNTITISLPPQTTKKIDIEAKKQGFSTRSEFVRNLIRGYFNKEEELELKPFKKRPLAEIRAEFEKTGKYNPEFIDSLIRGLAKSSIYANKTTKS